MSIEKFAFNNLSKRHPKIKKNGLNSAVRSFFEHDATELPDITFIPDATIVDERTIWIYEIEDTSKLTAEKLKKIQSFAIALDDLHDIRIRLVSVDRYGITETEIYDAWDDRCAHCVKCGSWTSEEKQCHVCGI